MTLPATHSTIAPRAGTCRRVPARGARRIQGALRPQLDGPVIVCAFARHCDGRSIAGVSNEGCPA